MRWIRKSLLLLLMMFVPCVTQAQEWTKYSNKEGQFSVEMPTKPELQSMKQPIIGGQLTYHFYISELANGDQVFMISRNDYPEKNIAESDPQTLLDACVEGAVKSREGKLIDQEKVTLKGYPGRKCSFSGTADEKPVMVWHECYLVENRLYQVMVMSKKENPPAEKVRNRFFNSFQITAKKAD